MRNAANQAADAAFDAARNAANQAASAAGNAEDEIVEVIKGWRTGGGGGRGADDTDPHLAPNLARHPIPARHVIASNARSPQRLSGYEADLANAAFLEINVMTERRFGITRACGLVGISRSLYGYRSRCPDCAPLRERIEEIAAVKRRYGERDRAFNVDACVPGTIARRRVGESERQCRRLRLCHTPA